MKQILKLAILALTAAYVSLLPNFYNVFSPEGRVYPLWDLSYYAAILSAIAIMGAIYGVLYGLVFRVWKPGRLMRFIRDALIVFVLCFILTRTVVSILDRSGLTTTGAWSWLNLKQAKILYYFVIPLPLIMFRLHLAQRAIRRVYAMLAPILAIVFVLPLIYPRFDSPDMTLPEFPAVADPPTDPASNASIYIFVFDEWSYDRTFPNDRVWEELPNVRALVESSTQYERAFSAGSRTLVSIPRFLFQTDIDLVRAPYGEVIDFACGPNKLRRPSLFSLAPSNWFTAAVGFYLNYPVLLEGQVDFAICLDNKAEWRTYGQSLRNLLSSQMAWARILGYEIHMKTTTPLQYTIDAEERIERDACYFIRNTPGHSMAFFHFCLPHSPYIWNAEGLKDPLPSDWYEHTETNYLDNLRRLDVQVGALVAALKDSGKWKSSLVIFTSDHSWRTDPMHPGFDVRREDSQGHSEWRHVPLIINEPGQLEPRVQKQELSLKELHQIIKIFVKTVEHPST